MTLDNKVLRETLLCMARRTKPYDTNIMLFSNLSHNSQGISLRKSEDELNEYMIKNDQRIYYIFGLGHHNGWKLMQSKYKSIVKGLIVSFGMYIPSHRVHELLLKELGVTLEEPPNDCPKHVHSDRKASLARQVKLDDFFPHLISIGYGSQIGNGATIVSHVYQGDYHAFGLVNIGRNVLIGANSVIGPGVNIGDNARINTGSYVFNDIPSDMIAAGNPAKIIGRRNKRESVIENGIPTIKRSIY